MQHEPPFVVHRGRTTSGVEVIASVPLSEYEGSMRSGARQMVFAAMSGGPEANRAVQVVRASAENPDDPNHGYSVIMWYLICQARREADEMMSKQGAAAAPPPPGPSVAGAPQGAPQAWAISSPPVGGQVPMQPPMQAAPMPGGVGVGGTPARSYSRVKAGSGAPKQTVVQPRGKMQPGGVRTQTKVTSGGGAPIPPHIQAQIAAARAAQAPAQPTVVVTTSAPTLGDE